MRNESRVEGMRWLRQAEEDLRWSKHLAEQGANHLACFLSQQVTEKAIKAFLYAQGEEIVLGHSVERLCHNAARYHPAFSEKVLTWSILDGFYISTRYPNGLPDGIPADVYTQSIAQQAVQYANEAVTFVKSLLDKQDKP